MNETLLRSVAQIVNSATIRQLFKQAAEKSKDNADESQDERDQEETRRKKKRKKVARNLAISLGAGIPVASAALHFGYLGYKKHLKNGGSDGAVSKLYQRYKNYFKRRKNKGSDAAEEQNPSALTISPDVVSGSHLNTVDPLVFNLPSNKEKKPGNPAPPRDIAIMADTRLGKTVADVLLAESRGGNPAPPRDIAIMTDTRRGKALPDVLIAESRGSNPAPPRDVWFGSIRRALRKDNHSRTSPGSYLAGKKKSRQPRRLEIVRPAPFSKMLEGKNVSSIYDAIFNNDGL